MVKMVKKQKQKVQTKNLEAKTAVGGATEVEVARGACMLTFSLLSTLPGVLEITLCNSGALWTALGNTV